MKNLNWFFSTMGTLLFSIGILLGFFLLSMIVWGDLEASLFSSSMDAEKSLSSLHCPVFLSPNETGKVAVTLKNPSDKPLERFTRVFISEGFVTLMREIKQTVSIPASGKENVVWEVYPEDAVYDRIIFFRVYVNAKYPRPSLGASCGIIMIDLWGLTGNQTLWLIILTSLVCIGIGILIWTRKIKPNKETIWNRIHSMYALAFLLFSGILIGYMGAWVIALLLLASAVLLVGIILGRRMVTPS